MLIDLCLLQRDSKTGVEHVAKELGLASCRERDAQAIGWRRASAYGVDIAQHGQRILATPLRRTARTSMPMETGRGRRGPNGLRGTAGRPNKGLDKS